MKLFIIIVSLLFVGCGGNKTSTVPTEGSEKTDYCVYADEVCREAESIQVEFNASEEEKKESLIPVLNSYIEHCESARKACKKSMH